MLPGAKHDTDPLVARPHENAFPPDSEEGSMASVDQVDRRRRNPIMLDNHADQSRSTKVLQLA
jgi:hypothetical protein